MHAALAFLNGAGSKQHKSRRAERKFLTLINLLCGATSTTTVALVPLAATSPRRDGRSSK